MFVVLLCVCVCVCADEFDMSSLVNFICMYIFFI